ncbi:MAG: acyl--CoA ligase [Proteobacteria bacterium]|nr:acyl--CoA ligase [Pseudomonadota bacterium]
MNLARQILDTLQADSSLAAVSALQETGPQHDDPHTPCLAWAQSRAQLLERAALWSARLRQEGLEPGQRVLLGPSRGPGLVALHLAVLSSGAVVVPLNSSLSTTEVEELLPRAQPSLVVTSPGIARRHAAAAGNSGCRWLSEDELSQHEQPAPTLSVETRQPADTALLLFTSGTTGRPKGVPLSHGELLANLDQLALAWQRNPDDRLLHLLPAHHFHGLVLGLYGSLLAGNEIVLAPRFDARACLDAIAALDVKLVMGVPTVYRRLLAEAGPDDSLATLRLALCGSAPLDARLWQRFHERFGIELVERYGLTETGIISSNLPGDTAAGSAGFPLPGTLVALCDHDAGTGDHPVYHEGRPGLPARGPGEVCVQGPTVFSGYLQDDSSPDTGDDADTGWFHTGDIGRFDERGRLYLDGRIKDLVISGGSNIVPAEIERLLSTVEGVVEVVVAGMPDDDLGEMPAAWIVGAPGADPALLERALTQMAEDKLARYKRPRRYSFVAELPRNAMGKLDRSALPRD